MLSYACHNNVTPMSPIFAIWTFDGFRVSRKKMVKMMKPKMGRISVRIVGCSVCCGFWFVAACDFAGVFGWAYARPADIETECVKIKLLPANTSIAPNGYFDADGNECVYRPTISDVCLPYFKDVPACPPSPPSRRQLNDCCTGFVVEITSP